ncbi:MAG: DUF3792 family protein [Ruminococcaceae bacterium]|nr:DUF3792 family protein [Oscillospiraceae bacterium]
MSFEKNDHIPARDIVLSGIKGFLISIISGTMILFGFAAITMIADDPASFVSPLGYAALYITAAIGGIVAARVSGDMSVGAMLCGGASGILMLILLILMSFIPVEAAVNPLSPLTTAIMYAAVPVSAALSGFLFKRKPSRKARHRRRR